MIRVGQESKYPAVYFERSTSFRVLHHDDCSSIKGGTPTCSIDTSGIWSVYDPHPSVNGVIGGALELRDEIIFSFCYVLC